MRYAIIETWKHVHHIYVCSHIDIELEHFFYIVFIILTAFVLYMYCLFILCVCHLALIFYSLFSTAKLATLHYPILFYTLCSFSKCSDAMRFCLTKLLLSRKGSCAIEHSMNHLSFNCDSMQINTEYTNTTQSRGQR